MREEERLLGEISVAPRAKVANPFRFDLPTPMGGLAVTVTGLAGATFASLEPLRFEGALVSVNGTATARPDGTWTVAEIVTAMPTGKDFARQVGRERLATFTAAIGRNLARAFETRQALLLKREVVAMHKIRKDLDEQIDRTCGMIDRWQAKLGELIAEKDRVAAEHAVGEADLVARIAAIEGRTGN